VTIKRIWAAAESFLLLLRRVTQKGILPANKFQHSFGGVAKLAKGLIKSGLVLLAGLLFSACGSSGGTGGAASTASSNPSSSTSSATVETSQAHVEGKPETILTDAKGMTLYLYQPDGGAKVTCTGTCAHNWPPVLLSSGEPAAKGSLPSKLTVLEGPNGRQVAYHGWPLYTFINDKKPGDTTGQGVGGKWFVATPELTMNHTGPMPTKSGA
jgi:predicted lipoprotein with Yx(FWY)xxD motif